MRYITQRITIISMRRPTERDINQELQWLGSSLGLFSLRDKDKSCFRLFVELIKSAKQRQPISSDELAYRLGLSRGTIIHHMNRLIETGLVIPDNNRYILRVNTLKDLVDEIEKDLQRTCEELKKTAREIDEYLGL